MQYGIGGLDRGQVAMPDAKRKTEVETVLQRLEAVISDLDGALSNLGSRLAPIARASTPQNSATQKVEAPPQSILASAIYIQSSRIINLTDMVREVIDRLEI